MSDITERLRMGFGGIVPTICDEAANIINSLQAENAELLKQIELPLFQEHARLKRELSTLRESMRWIPVGERLPEYTAHAGLDAFVIVLASYVIGVGEAMYCNGKWKVLGGIDCNTVTHWMPIPKPPEDSSDE